LLLSYPQINIDPFCIPLSQIWPPLHSPKLNLTPFVYPPKSLLVIFCGLILI
jgi:hypothetical protein